MSRHEVVDLGGPAFPCASVDGLDEYQGMSRRDYFAGQALIMQSRDWSPPPSEIAKRAYALADAMIAEAAKGGA